MTIKSVDKLRSYANVSWEPWSESREHLHKMLDEIEREIAERFMELPCDKDGVPIHTGDTIEFKGNRGIVQAINERMVVVMHVDSDYLNYAKYGLLWDSNDCRHVKPRTLEDVLADVVTLCANTWKDGESPFAFYDVSDVMESGNIREYAAEIRELLGKAGDQHVENS